MPNVVPGTYLAKCKAHYPGIRPTKDGPMRIYVMEFDIAEGPNMGQTMNFEGGLKGKGVDLTMKAMETAGWDRSKKPSGQVFDKQVKVVVEERTYTSSKDGQVKRYGAVQYVNSVDGPQTTFSREKLNPQEVSDFDDELMAMAKAQDEAKGVATPSGGGGGSAGGGGEKKEDFGRGGNEDEDIPFGPNDDLSW